MNVLPRHDLLHDDGRRVFVYGELGADSRLARRGAEAGLGGIHMRFDLLTREWVARRHGLGPLAELTPAEQLHLVRTLRDAQEAPRSQPDWHLAFEFLPFQRSPTKTKIRATVETATGLFHNDVLPEQAARDLAGIELATSPLDESCLFAVQPEATITARMGARS